jgi:membrane-bound inhibitor of C-type lysozyme
MNQNNSRWVCLALCFVILTIVLGCSSGKAFKGTTYKCDDGRGFVADFYEKADIVFLNTRGRTISLHRIPSTSGIKYTDGNTTFWIKGDTAFVETDGRIEFKNCSAKPK